MKERRNRSLEAYLRNGYESDFEWYTPWRVVEYARVVLDGIDLDPASCELANQVIRADRYFTKEQDGLQRAWRGCVWCNPPYGRGRNGESRQAKWFDYGEEEYRSGRAKAIIFLFAAELTHKWIQDRVFRYPFCITRGRLNFWNADSEALHNPRGSMLVYLGTHIDLFAATFAPIGKIWLPGRRKSAK